MAVASTDHGVGCITTGSFRTFRPGPGWRPFSAGRQLGEHVDHRGVRSGPVYEGLSQMTVSLPGTPMSGLGTQIVHQMVRGVALSVGTPRGWRQPRSARRGARTAEPGVAAAPIAIAVFSAACASCPRGAAFGDVLLRSACRPRRPEPWIIVDCHCRYALDVTSRHTARFGHWRGGPRVPDGKKVRGRLSGRSRLLRQSCVFLRYRVL